MNTLNYCYGCFEALSENQRVCPYCGYVLGTEPEEPIHLVPGTILSERYIIGKVIGYGGFGVTYIGWDTQLEQKVAIKEYLPSEFSTRSPGQSYVSIFSGLKKEQFHDGLNRFVDEANKLSKFNKEDGIVRIFDCIAENDTAYIIMEYLQGETLSERLKRDKTIPEKEAIDILMPVMRSLEVVHKEGIIHRDIAPDNIFLCSDGKVKLIDFGAARFATTSHSRSLTVIIKPGYSAEEQYRSRSDQGPYTDVYALAATLYKMITGQSPIDALERRAKIENAKKDILVEPHKLNRKISLYTENAVLNALNIRIEDRTQTVEKFIAKKNKKNPVKRVYGKIKRIDFYRIPVWIKIFVPSILIVFIAFGVLMGVDIIHFGAAFNKVLLLPSGYAFVPDIEGMSKDEAIAELQKYGLNYSTGGNIASDYLDSNVIIYQYPEAGKIMTAGSTIKITLSRGTGQAEAPVNGVSTVPVFIWSNEANAVRDFEKAGLKTVSEYVLDKNVSVGQVIRATDEKGNEINEGDKIPEKSVVKLYVSATYVDNDLCGIWYNDEAHFSFRHDSTGYMSTPLAGTNEFDYYVITPGNGRFTYHSGEYRNFEYRFEERRVSTDGGDKNSIVMLLTLEGVYTYTLTPQTFREGSPIDDSSVSAQLDYGFYDVSVDGGEWNYVYPILSDAVAFMLQPDSEFRIYVNKDELADRAVYCENVDTYYICLGTQDSLIVYGIDGSADSVSLFYSFGTNTLVVRRLYIESGCGYDCYQIFKDNTLVTDSADVVDKKDGYYVHTYYVDGISVSEDEFNARKEMYGSLVTPSTRSSRYVTYRNIESENIPELRDEIIRIVGKSSVTVYEMQDINDDDIDDCILKISKSTNFNDWKDLSFTSENNGTISGNRDCFIILQSSSYGVTVKYLTAEEALDLLD